MAPNTLPNSVAIIEAIAGYCSALTYANGSPVFSIVQIGEIKDVTTLLANGNACLEIYANTDNSQHLAFGGKITDEQTWFLLSLVSLDDAQAAELQILTIRDALVQPFQMHATLGAVGSVYHSQIKNSSGKFVRIYRNNQWVRGHTIELLTRQEWFVPTPPGVIG